MDIIKFAKIDWLKTRPQANVVLLFLVIACVMGINMDLPAWSLFYVAFGATIIASAPYFIDSAAASGFIYLLPAKTSSRVYGRYLFGTCFIIITILLGEVCMLAYYIKNKTLPNYLVEVTLLVIAIAIIMNTFQFLVLSIVKTKNQQLLSIIRMVPPFLMFFGGNLLIGYISKNKEMGLEVISDTITYVMEHSLMLSILAVVFALILTVIAAVISGVHESHRVG